MFLRLSAAGLLALSLISNAYSAPASPSGWTATQTIVRAGQTQTIGLAYANHRLKISTPKTKIVLDFAQENLTYINVKHRAYATSSWDDLAQQRKQQLKQIRSLLPKLPPVIKTQILASVPELSTSPSTPPKLVMYRSGKHKAVDGLMCEVTQWSYEHLTGTACLAETLPIDVTAFRNDSRRFVSYSESSGIGAAVVTASLMQLVSQGFPMTMNYRLYSGRQTTSIEVSISKLKRSVLTDEAFMPPSTFKQQTFDNLQQYQKRQLMSPRLP